jgi:hypothetical protein
MFVENQRLDLSREPQRLKPQVKAMFIAALEALRQPKLAAKKSEYQNRRQETACWQHLCGGGEESPCGR